MGDGRNARVAFIQIPNGPLRSEVLLSHFISPEAFQDLINDDFEHFIIKREASILAAEQSFLAEFGLRVDGSAERNIEEIDADE